MTTTESTIPRYNCREGREREIEREGEREGERERERCESGRGRERERDVRAGEGERERGRDVCGPQRSSSGLHLDEHCTGIFLNRFQQVCADFQRFSQFALVHMPL